MKIFVLGTTYCGKTPIADAIADRLEVSRMASSAWARESFEETCDGMQEFVERLTAHSVRRLRFCFDEGLVHLQSAIALHPIVVIDGERNPFDFVHLFSPSTDYAIFLSHRRNPIPSSIFEQGVMVIRAYLQWLVDNGFCRPEQHRVYEFDVLYTRDRIRESDVALDELLPSIVSTVVDSANAQMLREKSG